jgi:hypothetical protein
MRKMTSKDSKSAADVLAAAEAVLKERYYQVKEKNRFHVRALSPIDLAGNSPVRKKIDVYVFLEKGFYMPKVSVRQYMDTAEPPQEQGGPITGRFPIEVNDEPYAADDWDPLYYDRSEEVAIRNAILDRLKVRVG